MKLKKQSYKLKVLQSQIDYNNCMRQTADNRSKTKDQINLMLNDIKKPLNFHDHG